MISEFVSPFRCMTFKRILQYKFIVSIITGLLVLINNAIKLIWISQHILNQWRT